MIQSGGRRLNGLIAVFLAVLIVFLASVVVFADQTDSSESSVGEGGAPLAEPDLSAGVSTEIQHKWSYVQEAPSVYVDEAEAALRIDPDFSDGWTVPTKGIRVSRQKVDDATVLQLNVRASFLDNEMKLIYPFAARVSEYDVLSFLVNIGTEESNYRGYFHVSVEMVLPDRGDGRETVLAETWVASNLWQEVVVDIWDVDEIEMLTVTVSCEGNVTPKMIRFASFYLDYSDSYVHIDRYLTHDFILSGGRLLRSDDEIMVLPVGSATELEGNFALSEYPGNGTQAFMFVTLSGHLSGGSVTMSYLSAGSGGQNYADTEPLPLRDGRYVYSFPFVASDDMISYRLSFRNVLYEGEGISVESVSVLFTEDIPSQTTGNGYVSGISLNRANGRLTIEGNVSQSIVTNYKKDELVVYAVPFTSFSRIEKDRLLWGGEEILRSKIFMNFELVADEEITSRYVGTHMFYVTVEGEGHEPILISQPRTVDYPNHNVEENSMVGIEGASAVGTFESNASHVVVDLPLDRLVLRVDRPGFEKRTGEIQLSSADTVKVSLSDGTMILVDGAVINEILAEIGFYNSANLEVYIRIMEESTPFFENVSILDAWDMEVYSAILSAVLSKDPALMKEALSGIILGEAVAYAEEIFEREDGSIVSSVYDYSSRMAALMSVTYSTVFSCLESSDVGVVIPYKGEGTFNDVVNQMVSYHCVRMGGLPWYVMYSFSSADRDADGSFDTVLKRADLLMGTSHAFGADGRVVGCLYFYIPDEAFSADEITFEYNSFLESVQGENPRAVFLSVRGLLDERKEQTYRQLKNIRKEEKNSIIESIEAEYGTFNGSVENTFTVWDFRNLYHNDGWVSGGAVSGCGTGRSEIFSRYSGISQRALRTKVYSNFENSMASAIVLRNLNQVTDLDGVDSLVFTFSVAETVENSTLIFVIGNERSRAEYTLTDVEADKVHTVRCPVAPFSGKGEVAYIGVMVYSGGSAVLEIQSVKLQSSSLSHEEMAALIKPASEESPGRSQAGFYAVGIFAVATVFAVVMLIRRDREDRELKNDFEYSRKNKRIIKK